MMALVGLWVVLWGAGEQTVAKVVPDRVYQGQVAVLQVSAPAPPLSLVWQGREIRFFPFPGGYRALIPIPADLKPGTYSITVPDGQLTPIAVSLRVLAASFPTQRIKLAPEKTKLYEAPEREKEREVWRASLRTVSDQVLWSAPFLIPVSGRKTTGFGVRRYYVGRSQPFSYHRGVDLAAPRGTPVKASNSGRVVLARTFTVEGVSVLIDHGQGVLTAYLHLHSASVQEGQVVSRGQEIGTVGDSGAVTGPHLHWALYVQGVPVDPNPWTRESWLRAMGLLPTLQTQR
ncbi:MAG: M23 family metallopeptidase [Armatimonadetes bacterium]|nr:M23 family metallopeptidase [Armatimonadota bacterium]MDW8121799.1 M23 family metallopeptidase [Armatimonadota bacterium]